jgi:type I site-specific restriction endonuclease
MPTPHAVLDLVERFERNREAYKSPSYNETQLRREFLDPFFEALGWDVNNRQGYGHDTTFIQRQIEATDRQIDQLVYELYGLTEEEIGVVEGRNL